MKYKAIIFDFDGVILDSVNIKTLAFEAMYLPYGKEVANKVREHHLLNGGISRYKKFRHYHQDFLGIELTELEVENLALEFSKLVFQKVLEASFIPGADIFLRAYSKKLQFFVATGTPQKEIDPIVKSRGLEEYFTSVHGSPTSKETIIEGILSTYNLSKDEVLFIGDAMTDYRAAEKKGLDFVGVANKDTHFPQGTKLINDITQLEELF